MVSRRLKQILEMAGIANDIFKGHSTWAALSTMTDVSECLFLTGLNLSNILKTRYFRPKSQSSISGFR